MDKQTVEQGGGKTFCITLYANDDGGFFNRKSSFFNRKRSVQGSLMVQVTYINPTIKEREKRGKKKKKKSGQHKRGKKK